MEKSRAIELLEHLAWDRDIERNPYGDALNMAIEALKAQLSSEGTIISRQWLLECVDEGWIKFDTEEDANRFIHLVRDIAPGVRSVATDICVGDTISRQALCEYALNQKDKSVSPNDIMRFPSAQPEPKWIPVSERLPDTNRDVLLQFSTSMGVGFWEHNSWGVNTGDNIYSEIGEGEAQPIAWMPLPEAYKPNK